jgi:hypothetical protein
MPSIRTATRSRSRHFAACIAACGWVLNICGEGLCKKDSNRTHLAGLKRLPAKPGTGTRFAKTRAMRQATLRPCIAGFCCAPATGPGCSVRCTRSDGGTLNFGGDECSGLAAQFGSGRLTNDRCEPHPWSGAVDFLEICSARIDAACAERVLAQACSLARLRVYPRTCHGYHRHIGRGRADPAYSRDAGRLPSERASMTRRNTP